jgi:hypothetical protein
VGGRFLGLGKFWEGNELIAREKGFDERDFKFFFFFNRRCPAM